MTGDVPSLLAGTDPNWTPRAPRMIFDTDADGRLRTCVRATGPTLALPEARREYKPWRRRGRPRKDQAP